ncbi:MAG: redoxin family protein [Deltaproteobacteria bacterium]|nr:redoxin family protein [Deltaproteobacteria bacterium]
MRSALFVALTLVSSTAFAEPAQTPPKPEAAPRKAEVGKQAPNFSLADLAGKDVKLSQFKGKTVVLEWFNPGCPYVKKSHSVGSLIDTAKRVTKDGTVAWLAINSGAAGKQGNALDDNTAAVNSWSMAHPVLRDESGVVGKMYGATNTPHIFIVDKTGTLVYAGAIDNSPDAEGKSAPDGKLVNYVDATLADLGAKRAVKTPVTKAYGCSVKYAN